MSIFSTPGANSIAPDGIAPHPREIEAAQQVAKFEETWKAVSLLKPPQKERLKGYWSLKQGRDGTRVMCYFCHVEFGLKQIQIHHHDHDRTNNQLSNLAPACEPCNNDERARWLSERNRNTYPAAGSVTIDQKEREQNCEIDEARLLKQAPYTTQKKVEYRQKALDYLLEYVIRPTDFDNVVGDIEALTGCSHNKAIEYADSFTCSPRFSPFRKWMGLENPQQIDPNRTLATWIAPRTIDNGKPHPEYQRLLDDYKKRKGPPAP